MSNEKEVLDLYIDLLKKSLTALLYEESSWEFVEVKSASLFRRPGTFLKNLWSNIAIKKYQRKAIILVKKTPFDLARREEGRDWPLFGFTMAGHKRLDNVQSCVEDVLKNDVPGDFIETGAWRGGTSIFMRALLKIHGDTERKVWVADSFQGLPKPINKKDGWDLSDVDYLKVDLEKVKSNFAKYNMLDKQVVFLKGWFSETLPTAPIEKISILRLDGDLYSSTMDALQNLYHKVSDGGYVIVDDYHSWPPCKKAVHDFLEEKLIMPGIKNIDWSGAYWKK